MESQTWAFIGKFETELTSKFSVFGGVSYASSNVDYYGELFAGYYSVFYNPSYYCSTSSPLPCQSTLLVGCPAGKP